MFERITFWGRYTYFCPHRGRALGPYPDATIPRPQIPQPWCSVRGLVRGPASVLLSPARVEVGGGGGLDQIWKYRHQLIPLNYGTVIAEVVERILKLSIYEKFTRKNVSKRQYKKGVGSEPTTSWESARWFWTCVPSDSDRDGTAKPSPSCSIADL